MEDGLVDAHMISEFAKADESRPDSIAIDGKNYNLSEQEKAAFRKLNDEGMTLFRRLDSGHDGTHDFKMGIRDIDAAIQNGRLHGNAEHSKEGYWRNRNKDMPPEDAEKKLNEFFSDTLGANWTLKQQDFLNMANAHGMRDPKDTRKFMMIDDPEVTRAAGVVLDNWSKLQNEGNGTGTLSSKDLEKLRSL